MKKIFLTISILSIFTLSSCEKISETLKVSPVLSESDKNISAEFIEKQTYQGNIDLSGLGLTQIPDFTKYLTGARADEITSISLSSNKISEINGDYFKNFLNLKELNLSFNKIKNTQGIEKIHSKILGKLELTKSGVEKIDGIGELKSLRELFLSFNNLKNVEGLENLENLNYLELTHNNLTNIDNLAKLNKLLTLKIEFNKIKNVDKILNNENSTLEMFTMKFNQIDKKIVKAIEDNNQKVYKLRNPDNKDELEKIEINK